MKRVRELSTVLAVSVIAVASVIMGAAVTNLLLRPAQAQVTIEASGLRAVPLGYQQITVLTASTALTVPAGATMAVFTPQTQAVRYRDDGVAPSATVGMPVAVGVSVTYSGNLNQIRFFEQAASAVLNVSYYR